MLKNLRALLTVPSLLVVTAGVSGQTIEEVAPDNTVIAIGVRNLSETMRGMGENPVLGGLEEADEDDLAEGLMELLPEDLQDAIGDAGEGPGITMPTGAVGLAVFATMNQELGVPEPAFMILADFGEGIDGVADRIAKVVAGADGDDGLSATTRQIEGRTVWSIDVPDIDPGDLAEEEDLFAADDDPFGGMLPMPGDLFDFEAIHVTRNGSSLIVSSHLTSLTNGLKAIDGKSTRNLASNEAFQGVIGQVGGTDAYTVVLTGHMMQLVGAMDPMGMMQMFAPMVRSAFGDIRGLGYGIDVAANDNGTSTQKFSILMPEGKHGLPGLLDTPLARTAPPAFIGGSVTSYNAISVELPEVVGFVDNFMKANPMMGMQFGPAWNEMKGSLEPIFGSLGTEMHMVTPGTADAFAGSDPVMVVTCDAPDKLTAMLAGMAEGGAVRSKNVGERTVYSFAMMDMMGMGMGMEEVAEGQEPALGVTDTHVLFGPESEVVKLMEAGGNARPLANDTLFHRAAGSLPDRPIVAWGYSDLSKLFDFGDLFGEVVGEDAADMISTDEMGAMVWYVESTDTGFVGSIQELPAAQAVNAADSD